MGGDRDVDGRKCTGFSVSKNTTEMEIWVDKTTGEMALIKMTTGAPGTPVSRAIMRDIVLNADLSDSLFSLQPPEGYALAEQNEEWACRRRYMSVESLAKARLTVIPGGDPLTEEVTPELIAAQ